MGSPPKLKRVRDRLQRVGAVVGHGLVFEDETTWHFAPLRRWDQVFDEVVKVNDPYAELVVTAVRAAVLTREDEVSKWFSWPVPDGVVEGLVSNGRLVRPAPGWLAVAG